MAKNTYLSMLSGSKRRQGGKLKRLFLAVFGKLDPVILGCTLFLNLFSVVILYGSPNVFGKSRLIMQCAMTLLGIVMMTAISHLDYRFIVNRYHIFFLVASVGLLLVTALFGTVQGGNQSWLTIVKFGDTEISVQPSEFVKISFICTFAYHLSRVCDRINHPKTLLLLALHAGLVVGSILLSGDLGVALVYIAIILFMLFAAGMSLWYDLGILVLGVAVFPFLWEFLEEYQQERILVGFNPSLDPLGKGMQPLLSRDAILNGGWLGQGFRGGDVYEILPASHTDFMFATVCEKFGFVGGTLVLIALVLLVFRILYLAMHLKDNTGKLIAVGVGAMLIVQSVENIGMCLAQLPVVGITLPFISYGGSSMLAIYLLFGVLHSVMAHGK